MEHLRVWLKDFNLFCSHLTQSIFSKNWTFFFLNFFWFDSKNWIFWNKTWLKELNPFPIWLKDWIFFQFDWKNWIWLKGFNFSHMTQRIGPISNMTHRIEHFFSRWLKELNIWLKVFFFWKIWLKELFFFFKKWLKELNRFELWLKELSLLDQNMTFKNWTFWKIWFKGLNLFEVWFKELNLFSIRLTELRIVFFFNLTQRIEYDSKHWTLFFNLTLRIEPSFPIWLTELNFLTKLREFNFSWKRKRWLEELIFWKYQSNKRNFLLTQRNECFFSKKMTHRTEPIFSYDTQNWTLFSNMTHKNWTLLFNMTQRIEPIFSNVWLKELNSFCK